MWISIYFSQNTSPYLETIGRSVAKLFLRISLPCPIHLPEMCAPQVKSCWVSTCRCRTRSRLPRAVTLSKAVSIPAATSRVPHRRAPARKWWPNRRHVKSWVVCILCTSRILFMHFVQKVFDQRSKAITEIDIFFFFFFFVHNNSYKICTKTYKKCT